MTDIVAMDAADLDFDTYAEMQKESFKDLLDEMGVSDSFMTPAFYRWKYTSPSGNAKVVIALNDGKMVGSTMMIPMVLTDGRNQVIAWQNGDTATIPSARKLGVYPRCMKKILSEVKDNELFFGFPNRNSIRGFSHFVKTYKGVVPLLAGMRLQLLRRPNRRISRVETFEERSLLADAWLPPGRMAFVKTAVYLEWRYTQHPVHQYSRFVCCNERGDIIGIIVTRKAVIQGKKALLIMELLGENLHVQGQLLRHAVAAEAYGRFILAFNSNYTPLQAARLGLVVVPPRFLPKRQVLYVSGTGPLAESAIQADWGLQMGDWDGF